MQEEGEFDSSLLRNVGLWALALGIYWFIRKDAGDYRVKKCTFEVIVALFVLSMGQAAFWISRYYMSRVTVNGFNGSILGVPVIIKDKTGVDWAIFNTGNCQYPVPMRGKLATLVVPLCQLHQVGSNFIGTVFARRTPFRSLPNQVYLYLVHNKQDYNLTNVFFGYYNELLQSEDPELMDLHQILADKESQLNQRDDIIEGRFDTLVEIKKFADELTGNNFSLGKLLRRKKTADDEE